MTAFDEHYWQERWQKGQTGWDIGGPAPAILQHFRSLDDKALSILIPGCGNAYEAKALCRWKQHTAPIWLGASGMALW